MVGPERIQPLGQASADCVLNGADNALYLSIAFTVANRRFLVYDSEHFAQTHKAPLKFRAMVGAYVSRFPPLVHDVLQELCCSPAM